MSHKLLSIRGETVFLRIADNTSIPLDMMNRDCVQLVADWKAGVATVTAVDGSAAIYSDAAVIALGLKPAP